MSIALVFPGQGAQVVGMGSDLAEGWSVARDILAEADEVLGMDLARVMAAGPEDELKRTDISQPAILTMSWMAYKVLEAEVGLDGVACTGGLSLGEYTALVAADVLGFADAVRLVRLRGQAMQEAADMAPSGMVALIGADEAGAAALCEQVKGDEVLTIANLNAPGQVVISGAAAACERAVGLVKESGKEMGIKRAIPLPVAGAFHSPFMAPAAEKLGAAIAATTFAEPKIPVYQNFTGTAGAPAAEIGDLLLKQLCGTVRWAACIEGMRDAGADRFIELGPGNTVCGMIKRIDGDLATANLATAGDVASLKG